MSTVNPPSTETTLRFPLQKKNFSKPISILFIVLLLITIGILSYQNYLLRLLIKENSAVSLNTPANPPSIPTLNPSPETDFTSGWQIYKNNTYNYQIKYPKSWRIASSIMEWYREATTDPRHTPLIEDWVMVTSLSAEEESTYLEALKNYEGIGIGMEQVTNADGKAITIRPTSQTIQEIKKNAEDQTPGWQPSNFREAETGSGLTVTRFRERITWEMDRDFETALVPYSGNQSYRDDRIVNLKFQIERNDGNYESEIFDQIVSTFNYLE